MESCDFTEVAGTGARMQIANTIHQVNVKYECRSEDNGDTDGCHDRTRMFSIGSYPLLRAAAARVLNQMKYMLLEPELTEES